MGMDFDLLVCIPRIEHGWYTSVWRDRVLAVPVSPSALLISQFEFVIRNF